MRFGVGSTDHKIDLTTENAEKLRFSLSKYVDRARKASARRKGQSTCQVTASSRSKREDTQQIHQWAQDNRYSPSSRGRITQSIVDAYTEAMK